MRGLEPEVVVGLVAVEVAVAVAEASAVGAVGDLAAAVEGAQSIP
jgi:hypothetical protein